jgi:hypothetical protein
MLREPRGNTSALHCKERDGVPEVFGGKQAMNYKTYIVSPEWRSKHKGWLKRAKYRCAFLPFLSLKKRYNCHHMNYENLGNEQLWVDVICVHPWVHKWILHGILSGFKRPSRQKNYPNIAQRLAHAWCCLPVLLRAVFVGLSVVNVLRLL